MKKLLLTICLLYGCEVQERDQNGNIIDKEYNSQFCVSTCIKELNEGGNIDSAAFSQTVNVKNNQFKNIIQYCESLRKYKCISKNGFYGHYGFDFNNKSNNIK